MNLRPFQPEDEAAVVELWRQSGLVAPQNDPHKDIRRKLAIQPALFIVATNNEAGHETIVGTVMIGYDGHRGWINYLATHPDHRRKGIATALMTEAEQRLRALGCPKINLQVRPTNQSVIDFYRAIGFDVEGAISLGKRLEKD